MNDYNDFLNRRESLIASHLLYNTSCVTIFIIITLYFALIIIGKSFMKNRQPFQLHRVLSLYNVGQIFFNIWLCSMFNYKKYIPIIRNVCSQPDEDFEATLLKMTWWYLINKIMDLFDTFFMILRKRNKQINLLHLYHHSTTIFMAWFHINYGPGILHILALYLNSLIHVIMYIYYFFAGLGAGYQKYLWWKKYLTSIQIFQFMIMIAFNFWILGNRCGIPLGVCLLCFGNPIVLLTLFAFFYRKSYRKRS